MTPYLSEDWFHLWRTALDEAEKLDMNVWIYDENSYPTGFAGGLVPEAMPDSRGKGLSVFRRDAVTDANGNWTAGPDIVYVVQVQADGSKRICHSCTIKPKPESWTASSSREKRTA